MNNRTRAVIVIIIGVVIAVLLSTLLFQGDQSEEHSATNAIITSAGVLDPVGALAEEEETAVPWHQLRVDTVEERGSRGHEQDEVILFSDPNVNILFNFNMYNTGNSSDVQRWYPQIEIIDETGESVAYTRQNNDNDYVGQIRIMIHQAPERDLRIRLASEEGYPDIERELRYTEPFTLHILPGMSEYKSLIDLNPQAAAGQSWYAANGVEYQVSFRFSTAPRREQVEQRLAEQFESQSWRSEWISDREIEVSFTLDRNLPPYHTMLDFNGIRNVADYELVGAPVLSLYPIMPAVIGQTELQSGQETTLFSSVYQWHRMVPSPSGEWMLLQLEEQSEQGPSLYALLDMTDGGRPVRLFDPSTIEQPVWLADGESFVFASGDSSEKQGIFQYFAGEDKVVQIWEPPAEEQSTEGELHWRRPAVAPGGNRIFIQEVRTELDSYTIRYDTNLYILEHVGDQQPRVIRDVQSGYCEGARCYGYFHAISDDAFVTEQIRRLSNGEMKTSFYSYELSTDIRRDFDSGEHPFAFLDQRHIVQSEQLMNGNAFIGERYYLIDLDALDRVLLGEIAAPYESGLSRPAVPLSGERYLLPFYWSRGVIVDVGQGMITEFPHEYLGAGNGHLYWRLAPE